MSRDLRVGDKVYSEALGPGEVVYILPETEVGTVGPVIITYRNNAGLKTTRRRLDGRLASPEKEDGYDKRVAFKLIPKKVKLYCYTVKVLYCYQIFSFKTEKERDERAAQEERAGYKVLDTFEHEIEVEDE